MWPADIFLTNPAMWTGVAALAAPLVIHVLTRKTTRDLVFPSLRFIRKARASQSALHSLRHVLMLLLRTAFLALLLLAFLKPVLQATNLHKEQQGRHAVILVLDDSASMGYTGAGFSPFARARQAAGAILDQLGAGDVANLILVRSSPRASFAEPVPHFHHLRNDLQNATPTLERADMGAAIATAVKQLGEIPGYKPEIHFISDFQRSNWASVDFSAIPKDVRTVFVPVGESEAANTAILEAFAQPAAPALSEEVEILCKVANYSSSPRKIPLELRFEGVEPMKREMDLQPNTTASASFRIKPSRLGILEGVLSIPDDGMASDNRRHIALQVVDRIQIAVLSDEPKADAAASSRFLIKAINPYVDAAEGSLSASLMGSGQFDKFAEARTRLVLISGTKEFSDVFTQDLLRYLQNGGAVVIFLTGASDKASLERLQKRAGDDLKLPFRMTGMASHPPGQGTDPATLTEANFDHPLLRRFKESKDLGEAQFYNYFTTERNEAQGQVLLRYHDKNIALAKCPAGQGALMICNFTTDLRGSDLAKRTIFVPFIHEILRNMRPQTGGMKPFVVGQPAYATVPLPSGSPGLRFTLPSGERTEAGVDMGREEASVSFPATTDCGFHRIHAGERHIGSAAVNVDGRESNLESLSPTQLETLSQISRDRLSTVNGRETDGFRELREGKPLWPLCILAALILLALEQTLSMIWKW